MSPAGADSDGRRARRLILHIGTHKTGTTSFQESLKVNADRLAAQGVGVVSEPFTTRTGEVRRRTNLMGLADLFIRPEIATGDRLRRGQGPVPGGRAAWARTAWALRLAWRSERDLILSSEGMCFLRTGREAARIRRFFAASRRRPLILLATRNPDDWRASWSAQLAGNARVRAGLAAADPGLRIDAPWYYDLAAIRAFWGGLGELREVDFDAAMAAEGNIVPQLYRAAGIDPAGLDVEVRLNTRAEKS